MEQILWSGELKDGSRVEIRRGSNRPDLVNITAFDESGKIVGDRTAFHDGYGRYQLTSGHVKFKMTTQQNQTVVERKGEKIGSRLIALMLSEIAKRGGTEVHLQGIENRRWARHLQTELGGQCKNASRTPEHVFWTKDQLTLDKKQPWHQFLE